MPNIWRKPRTVPIEQIIFSNEFSQIQRILLNILVNMPQLSLFARRNRGIVSSTESMSREVPYTFWGHVSKRWDFKDILIYHQ